MASIDDGRGAEGEYDGEGCREKRQQKLFGAGRRGFSFIFISFLLVCLVSFPFFLDICLVLTHEECGL